MCTVIAVFNSLSVRGRSRYTADFAAPHCDEVQAFLGIFQQITPALNRSIYCLLERRIQQEKTRSSIERTTLCKN
jgi:hypothetical protein